jgi:hypothetical protein
MDIKKRNKNKGKNYLKSMGEFYGHTNIFLKNWMITINVHYLSIWIKRTCCNRTHTQEKENITRTPYFLSQPQK